MAKNKQGLEPKPILFLKVIGTVFLVTVFTIVLEHIGWLRGFELAALDTKLRVRHQLFVPDESKYIIVVGINDNDYQDIFSSKSPLDKEGLLELINAIAKAKPAVLAVDIDTSDKQFIDMHPTSDVPIVWAEDAPPKDAAGSPTSGALGGRNPGPQLRGIARLPMGDDGIIRSYTREVGGRDSFPWVVVRTFCKHAREDAALNAQLKDAYSKIATRCEEIERINNNEQKKGELAIDFLGDRYKFQHYSAREVLDANVGNGQKLFDKLGGKIVLLGGLFYAARDEYTTPVGRMAGVELMAHAVESELQGGGFPYPNEIIMVLLSIVGGVVITVLFIRLGLKMGCLVSIILIFIMALILSLVAFRSLAYVTYFLPILFAVLIHQLYEQAHYYQHQSLHSLPHKERQESSRGTEPADEGGKADIQPKV